MGDSSFPVARGYQGLLSQGQHSVLGRSAGDAFLPASLKQLPVGWSSCQIKSSRIYQELAALKERSEWIQVKASHIGLSVNSLPSGDQTQTFPSIKRCQPSQAGAATLHYGSELLRGTYMKHVQMHKKRGIDD